ncbi:hypothetical protein PAHAL_1G235100 [Panicum hallii]|uniref:Uncharacterized protein n=1 Tax=Panicum hallii TaxID=206008 RepID=A0A2T8KW65_9POAL|nr:hypothetical protein PAHAL_1G235100 [Panicum hallii]
MASLHIFRTIPWSWPRVSYRMKLHLFSFQISFKFSTCNTIQLESTLFIQKNKSF